MSVPSDTELRAYIRARLAEGTLPSSANKQNIYGGYGGDEACDCCGRLIGHTDVLYEVELLNCFAKPLAMHLKCFDTWVAESQSKMPGLASLLSTGHTSRAGVV